MEHYVTLFDRAFLPQGLALLASLRRHAGPFTLWVLAMDETTAQVLESVGNDIRVIPLAEVETAAHLDKKPGRTRGEWCWTMTSSCFRAVFERDPSVSRVTYLDADVWFLSSPLPLFTEFEQSGKQVLITDHHYDPLYEQSNESGRFCVQFLTVVRVEAGLAVIDWWCERCIEWCFNRVEAGRFGDQKYLDRWPELFPDNVHILNDPWAFTAPWNHRMQVNLRPVSKKPVFHHFHGFRALEGDMFLWWWLYRMGHGAHQLYRDYQDDVERGMTILVANGVQPTRFPDQTSATRYLRLKRWYHRLRGSIGFAPQRSVVA